MIKGQGESVAVSFCFFKSTISKNYKILKKKNLMEIRKIYRKIEKSNGFLVRKRIIIEEMNECKKE